MHAPTISHQTDPAWVSLEVILDEKQARDLIPGSSAAAHRGSWSTR
jgi:hypothetical protein